MSYPSLIIPKLECSFFDFNPGHVGLPKTTVKALKLLCKANGLTQTGLKADLIKKVQDAGLFPVIDGETHPPGPRWFWYDEAFGQGAHNLYLLCVCGAPMSMSVGGGGYAFRFSASGIVSPSIKCGNNNCKFHFWGKMGDWKDSGVKSKRPDYDSGRHRLYQHEKDKMSSKIWNNRWYG